MQKTSKLRRLISTLVAMVTVFTFVTFVLPNGCITANAANTAFAYAYVHVQDDGWMGPFFEEEVAGTEGQSKRLEKISLTIFDSYGLYVNSRFRIRTYQEDKQWVNYSEAKAGYTASSGTEGESRRIEAVQIELMDKLARDYNIQYCVHVQNVGWTDWVNTGAVAGYPGSGLRVEAFKFRLVRK